MIKRVFCFWTDDNPMSDTRKSCLATLKNTECTIELVTKKTLNDWLLPTAPLHPAYDFLSAVHRSDYLRAYFMHHHGGGYSDIKTTYSSWLPAFEALEKSQAFGIGYQEKSHKGVAHIHRNRLLGDYYLGSTKSSKLKNWLHYQILKRRWRQLIGNGAYIFRPNTEYTATWLAGVEFRLDLILDALKANPSDSPRSSFETSSAGSAYPLPWSGICADVFHPLAYQYRTKILKGLPRPDFKNYL